jgi:2-alkyl-3-oxoalkanoate reductase
MIPLVTGATGFLGSHVVDALLAEGLPAKAFVRSASKAENLRDRGVDVVVGDILDAESWKHALHGADAIYHCAAAAETETSAKTAQHINLAALRLLLEAVRRRGSGRIVLPTGLSVLGVRDLDPCTEELTRQRRGDPEIDGKIEAEELALRYHARHGVDVTILRPSFIYGPRDQRNLPSLVDLIRRRKFVYVGSRRIIVPLLHVQDAVQAMLLAGRCDHASGRIYHVTDGTRTTLEEVVAFLAGVLAVEPPHRVIPRFVVRAGCRFGARLVRFGILRRAPLTWSEMLFVGTSRYVDISRAKEELGYAPRVTFREGMAATLKWIQEQTNERAQPFAAPAIAQPN